MEAARAEAAERLGLTRTELAAQAEGARGELMVGRRCQLAEEAAIRVEMQRAESAMEVAYEARGEAVAAREAAMAAKEEAIVELRQAERVALERVVELEAVVEQAKRAHAVAEADGRRWVAEEQAEGRRMVEEAEEEGRRRVEEAEEEGKRRVEAAEEEGKRRVEEAEEEGKRRVEAAEGAGHRFAEMARVEAAAEADEYHLTLRHSWSETLHRYLSRRAHLVDRSSLEGAIAQWVAVRRERRQSGRWPTARIEATSPGPTSPGPLCGPHAHQPWGPFDQWLAGIRGGAHPITCTCVPHTYACPLPARLVSSAATSHDTTLRRLGYLRWCAMWRHGVRAKQAQARAAVEAAAEARESAAAAALEARVRQHAAEVKQPAVERTYLLTCLLTDLLTDSLAH